MVMAVFLGMGMPTSGAYVVLATLLVPALVTMLVPHYQESLGLSAQAAAPIALVAAHMFIIFCASKSSITPPVAIASYAAAAIANSDPWKTSVTAFRIGLPIFIIPYMFVYGPQLMGYLGATQVIWSSITATIGVLVLSVTCIGWLFVPLTIAERALSGMSALLLMYAGLRTDLIGLALLALLVASAYWRYTRMRHGSAKPKFARSDMVSDDAVASILPAVQSRD
jgi:TRAP-type uncharacterized transport system fused permease subunit